VDATDGRPRREAPGLPTSAVLGARDALLDRVQITVRPIASPSMLGLFGLAGGTLTLAGLQLGWVAPAQGKQVAIVLIGFAAVAQVLASVLATFARDGVVSTAMGVLGLSWLVIGLVLYTSPPGTRSKALGLFLVFTATAMTLIGLTAALAKLVPALVFVTAALRFALTAVYELAGGEGWKTAAGVSGLPLFVLAMYGAFALLVEGATAKTVLPIGRRGRGALAVHGSLLEQIQDTPAEPGVRVQL